MIFTTIMVVIFRHKRYLDESEEQQEPFHLAFSVSPVLPAKRKARLVVSAHGYMKSYDILNIHYVSKYG
jgi:hypothetical protein